MAAAPSKPSPSNRPMDGNNEATAAAAAKEDTVEATVAAPDSAAVNPPAPTPVTEDSSPSANVVAPTTTTNEEKPPTYESVEASDFFLLAKSHLSQGKFEEAMGVIEQGINSTRELLKRTTSLDEEVISIHESMAPLHYTYGTILLYSIEESDQEVTTAGSAVSTAVVKGEGVAAATQAANADATTTSSREGEGAAENQPPTVADVQDDMQIAWENFEAARYILKTMINNKNSGSNVDKLELDLAQLFLREGDLQRMNGRNEAAIQDYQSCLRLRKKSKFLGKHDRKIADVHYNIGLVYMALASIDETNSASDDDDEKEKSNLAAGKVKTAAEDDDDEKSKEAKRVMYCNKSVYHYLECSKCFCGQIANICNADPNSILTIQQGDPDNNETGNEGDVSPKYKTTGEEDEEIELPKVASSKLSTMRKRVKELVSKSDLTTEKRAEVEDLCQLLDDIQETVDEAESSSEGVREVTNMKAEVAAMAAADGEVGETKKEGNVAATTTTIGFGGGGAAASESGDAPAVAAAAASANSTVSDTTRPMMVVKKKKKRAVLESVKQPENKKPKPEAE